MNNIRLDQIIRHVGDLVEGENGYWHFMLDGIRLVCLANEEADRMRVIVRIERIEDLTGEIFKRCLEANFDRALEARYCIDGDMLWGAFIHPLSSLTHDLFIDACRQVSEVQRTFGTTFASGPLSFQYPS